MIARTPKVIEAPTVEPVTVDEARSHLEARVYDDSDVDPSDDAMIEGWITAAREHCEQFLGLSLARKTLEIALDDYPDDSDEAIDLPFGPVLTVLSITQGTGTDAVEWDAGEWVLDEYRRPERILPVTDWPTATAATNNIRIRYLAGYGVDTDGGEAIPRVIKAAILLMIGHLYENREATVEKAMEALPLGVEALLRPYRVRLGMA